MVKSFCERAMSWRYSENNLETKFSSRKIFAAKKGVTKILEFNQDIRAENFRCEGTNMRA